MISKLGTGHKGGGDCHRMFWNGKGHSLTKFAGYWSFTVFFLGRKYFLESSLSVLCSNEQGLPARVPTNGLLDILL